MSNFLAIATVTAALSQMLSEALVPDVDDAKVTTFRPDGNGNMPTTGVNIFLYQVTPNAASRNADLPTRRANGDLIQRPRAALDLHYLMTFHGDEGKLVPQRVLGSVIRSLHAQPILPREFIRKTIARNEFDFLVKSNLADAIELVKFSPLPLSLEDLSKLWSVYFQTPYSLSIAYQATVVLIESEDSTHAALPVRARNIYVAPFRQPEIETVISAAGANEPILASSTVVISGKRLRGDLTQVAISGLTVVPAAADLSDTRISVKLPVGLRVGVQGVQVVQPRLIGTPPVSHRGVQSNLAPIVLHPQINKKPDNTPDVSVSPVTIATDGTRSAEITVKVTPLAGKTQRAVLLLNELNAPGDRAPHALSFEAALHNRPADPVETDTLVFPFSGVSQGDYLARVQVDGADSPLEQDPNESDPKYIGPKVTIP